MKTRSSIRGRIFAPVFYTIDAALGVTVMAVIGVYMLRRYAEYKIVGSWGERISPRYPDKESANGKSYGVSWDPSPVRGDSTFTGSDVENNSSSERY